MKAAETRYVIKKKLLNTTCSNVLTRYTNVASNNTPEVNFWDSFRICIIIILKSCLQNVVTIIHVHLNGTSSVFNSTRFIYVNNFKVFYLKRKQTRRVQKRYFSRNASAIIAVYWLMTEQHRRVVWENRIF